MILHWARLGWVLLTIVASCGTLVGLAHWNDYYETLSARTKNIIGVSALSVLAVVTFLIILLAPSPQ